MGRWQRKGRTGSADGPGDPGGQAGITQPGLAGPREHLDVPGPIVVHVRDARSGDIEVFSGTSQTRLRDKDLAARIARAAG